MDSSKQEKIKIISDNRKAHHDFFILETYEAGISLTGTEVKSMRMGRVNLKDSYGDIRHGEIYLDQMHISPYEQGNRFNHDPLRSRKLLLHKREIRKLIGMVSQQGVTLVPLKLYFSRGKVKVELAVAKGKKLYDKRDALAERDAKREMDRAFRGKE